MIFKSEPKSTFSPDGDILAFNKRPRGMGQIAILYMNGDKKYKTLFENDSSMYTPKFYPDGNWLAYVSVEEGQMEVYVSSFPDVNIERVKISIDGGYQPLWSHDGEKLYYRNGNKVMAVSVVADKKFTAKKPEELFAGDYWATEPYVATWDIHPDGKRFLMIKPVETKVEQSQDDTSPKINVILNWFEELKEKVPSN